MRRRAVTSHYTIQTFHSLTYKREEVMMDYVIDVCGTLTLGYVVFVFASTLLTFLYRKCVCAKRFAVKDKHVIITVRIFYFRAFSHTHLFYKFYKTTFMYASCIIYLPSIFLATHSLIHKLTQATLLRNREDRRVSESPSRWNASNEVQE